MKDSYEKLRPLMYDLQILMNHGCSNGNCKMRRKIGGMHTNGPCRCLLHLSELTLAITAEAEQCHLRRDGAPLLG